MKAAVFSYSTRGGDVHGTEVREWGEEGVLVELRGEFDQHNLKNLRQALSAVVVRCPTMLDLSRVTFLDIEATRELAIQSQLYAHHLTLCNPSWQVRRSVAACGFEAWLDFRSDVTDPAYCRAS
jgi:anti-anti-sigma factor